MLLFCYFFFLMIRRPTRSKRTDTLFPYTTLFRSVRQKAVGIFQLGAKFGCGLEAVGKQGDDLFLHFLRPCLIMLPDGHAINALANRSEEHTSELQSLIRISYAVFCLKKKTKKRSKHIQCNRKLTHNDEKTL